MFSKYLWIEKKGTKSKFDYEKIYLNSGTQTNDKRGQFPFHPGRVEWGERKKIQNLQNF